MTQLDRASAFEAEGCRVEPCRGRPTRSEQPGFVEPTGVEREVCAKRMCVTHELRTACRAQGFQGLTLCRRYVRNRCSFSGFAATMGHYLHAQPTDSSAQNFGV